MNLIFASGKTEPINLEVAGRRFMITPVPQSIDTAPRDGTTILGWLDLGRCWTAVEFVYGDWVLALAGAYASDSRCEPTHWMPQPGAPA